MIEPMWLKTQVLFNDVPTEVRPTALDVAVKLNEVIEALNSTQTLPAISIPNGAWGCHKHVADPRPDCESCQAVGAIPSPHVKNDVAVLEIEIKRPNKSAVKFYARLDEGGHAEQTDNKTFKITVKRLKSE